MNENRSVLYEAQAGVGVLRDDEIVGSLTSPTCSPGFDVIGLAILHAEFAVNGTSVLVRLGDDGQKTARAFVTDLTIDDPHKRKPRGG